MVNSQFLLALKAALELAYSEGISRILHYDFAWDESGMRLTGKFLAEKNLFSFAISPDSISYDPLPAVTKVKQDARCDFRFALRSSRVRQDARARCGIGRACGDTCISREKGCRVQGIKVSRAAGIVLSAAKTEFVLKEHQTRIAEKLRNQRGLIVYHGLGSGKTLTAINAAEEYGGAAVIVPASLRENFKKELLKAKAQGQYDLYSYDEFRNKRPDLEGRMLIVDEAHRLRNASTDTSKAIAEQSLSAEKVLLLTGTPIQNKPHDISQLINIAAGRHVLPASESGFGDRYLEKKTVKPSMFDRLFQGAQEHTVVEPKNLQEFRQQTDQYVDHYQPLQEGYPTVTKQTVDVPMDKKQLETYRQWSKGLDPITRRKMRDNLPLSKQEAGDLNVFINAQRQIANTPSGFDTKNQELSPKFTEITKRLKESEGPALIYSNYLDSGVEPLSRELSRQNISNAMFTGELNDRQKKQIVEDYNAGKLKALIVSSSGGEGLDLKNTAQVHITEPHWNTEKTEQVIGRAVRYQSHSALPEDKQHVDIFEYQSVSPDPKEITADQYLTRLGQTKKALNNQFLEGFKKTKQDAQDPARPPFALQLKKTLELAYSDGISRVLDWHLNNGALTGRFLDGNELFNFTASAKGISFQQTEMPKNDAWLTGFLAQANRTTSLLKLDSAETWLPTLLAIDTRNDSGTKGKSKCTVGRGCGDGCISKDKQCRITTPKVRYAAAALVRRATTETESLEKAYDLPAQPNPSDPAPAKATPTAKPGKRELTEADRIIRAHEDKIRLNPTESAFAVDRDGKVVFQKQGEATSVEVTEREMKLLKDTIFTHNHPSSYHLGYNQEDGPRYEGAGFSQDDLEASCHSEVAELRAVAPEARYSLKPPAEGWNKQYWDEKLGPVYKKHDKEVYGELIEAYHRGEKNVADINLEFPHLILTRTAKELGLEYKREPILITDEDVDRITGKTKDKKGKTEKAPGASPAQQPQRSSGSRHKPNYWKGLKEVAAIGVMLAVFYSPRILAEYRRWQAQKDANDEVKRHKDYYDWERYGTPRRY